jgi:hypothetical protein
MGTLDRGTGVNLTKLFDECPPTDPLASYQADIREWAITYLAVPHPNKQRDVLGRMR